MLFKKQLSKLGWLNGTGIAIAIALLGAYGYQIKLSADTSFKAKTAILSYENRQVATLEVKATPKEQAMGLQGQDNLPSSSGILFPVQPPKLVQVWMYNVKFPIDIIFLKDGKIQGIIESAPPCSIQERCTIYRSQGAVDTVIELPAGTAKTFNLQAGTQLEVKLQDIQHKL
ncbi:MAG: DUF192 domain-containing protein [Coleofasciculus sp. S288]|nr:DUF192 domain-containing protein [Coleofasciculus sp. S288]